MIYQKLILTDPDGFHVMNEEERGKLKILGEGQGEVLTDPDRHIILSVGWKPLPRLAGMLLSNKDLAKQMEAKIRKPMQAYGYRRTGFVSRSVGGEKAEGFTCEYESQGIGMFEESLVVKHGRNIYYLHFYARQEAKAESLPVWEEILSGAEWV